MSGLNLLEETRFEKLPVKIFETSAAASLAVARRIAGLIRQKQRNNEKAVFGLATGAAAINVYRELVLGHRGFCKVSVLTNQI